jgi:Ca2+-binding RTX toxin-like protein
MCGGRAAAETRRMKKIVATAFAAVLVGATAGAVPARAANPSWAYVENGSLVVQAALFATNAVTMVSGGTPYPGMPVFWVTDANADIQLDPARTGGCWRPEPNSIVCPENSVTAVSIRLSDQNDTLTNNIGNPALRVEVSGGDGNDVILGGSTRDTLRGDAGADRLEGRAGHDAVYGGAGDDLLYGGDGNDRLDGEAGRDEAHGEAGDDFLISSDGRDRLLGSFGRDTIDASSYVDGGWDDDWIAVWPDSSGDLYGGAGYDTLDYRAWTTGVHVSLDGNTNDGGPNADCDDWIGCPVVSKHNAHGDFERVLGSFNDDKLSGNGEPDHFYGGDGNDALYGNGGDDLLDAESGTGQSVNGGLGDDICRGTGITRSGCELP